jgi:hypothetical protein
MSKSKKEWLLGFFQKKREEVVRDHAIGELVAGKGVYVGVWEPRDGKGKSLGKVFNIYAAPANLRDESGAKSVFGYNEALSRIAGLKNWHGANGAVYANEDAFYQALKDGSYKGEWVLPPYVIATGLTGAGNENKLVQADNLFSHQHIGALKDTFNAAIATDGSHPQWYWTFTDHPKTSMQAWAAWFPVGFGNTLRKAESRLSCRPVRFELRA